MAEGVVVAAGALVGSGVEQDEFIPLAHDRPVGRAADGAARECQPVLVRERRTRLSERRRVADRERRPLAHHRWRLGTPFDKRGDARHLQVLLCEVAIEFVANACDLAFQPFDGLQQVALLRVLPLGQALGHLLHPLIERPSPPATGARAAPAGRGLI